MRTATAWRLLAAVLTAGVVVAVGCLSAQVGDRAAPALDVRTAQNTRTVPAYDVFEITFTHDQRYADPFLDVTLEVTFVAPSGREVKIGGFHYGSTEKPQIRVTAPDARGRKSVEYLFDKANTWKARFSPEEIGRWRYSYAFSNAVGGRATGEGEFSCVKGRAPRHGFVREKPQNPFRWVFDDGTPYYPIGLQECLGDGEGTGSCLSGMSMEGPFRLDRQGRPTLPPGPLYVAGPSMNPQNSDVYFRRYGRCGFNLFRFSQQNCSYVLYNDLDHYLPQQGIMTDELLQTVRKYGFRVFYGIFGYQNVFNERPEDAAGMEKVKRFIKYTVDRWGATVDFWEFLNEQKASDGWYAIMIPYLKSIDPYHHPVATSWERPELPGIEVNAPHWYEGYSNGLGCDQSTAGNAANWKHLGKPVIVGEQGNYASKEQLQQPGIGGVWDAGSSVRMRIRNWTAFFNEIAFVFWNTSYARDGHFMNIWLGPKEREYVRAMQDFAYSLGPSLRMTEVGVSDPQSVHAYALASGERAGVYLHHYRDHAGVVQGLSVTVDVPKAGKAYWYSTETAAILGKADAPAGTQTFAAPHFAIDLALIVTPLGAPDIDHDGKPNDVDPDNDNDGAPNAKDAFPLEPEEWADTDGDGIGDNLDADKNGDGIADDDNHNGIPDYQELDSDGDGVNRAKTVPWDAFPLDPKEWRDTDGDGIGDNSDPDTDGDGWTNAEERKAGTDPHDPLNFPAPRGRG